MGNRWPGMRAFSVRVYGVWMLRVTASILQESVEVAEFKSDYFGRKGDS